ncbi:hypothetical protein FJ656_29530, partial [Schumannella luteola]
TTRWCACAGRACSRSGASASSCAPGASTAPASWKTRAGRSADRSRS